MWWYVICDAMCYVTWNDMKYRVVCGGILFMMLCGASKMERYSTMHDMCWCVICVDGQYVVLYDRWSHIVHDDI